MWCVSTIGENSTHHRGDDVFAARGCRSLGCIQFPTFSNQTAKSLDLLDLIITFNDGKVSHSDAKDNSNLAFLLEWKAARKSLEQSTLR